MEVIWILIGVMFISWFRFVRQCLTNWERNRVKEIVNMKEEMRSPEKVTCKCKPLRV